MKNDIGIDCCHHIVQNDSIPPLQSFLQAANRKGFENVEKTEKKETDDDETSCFRNPEHGDQETNDLIDDNPLVIFFPKESLGIF